MLSTFILEADIFGKYAIIISIGCFVAPILVLAFIVCFKFLFKKIKQQAEIHKKAVEQKHHDNPTKKDYYMMFGGEENMNKVTKADGKIIIEIADMRKVNFSRIKELGIGVLVRGKILSLTSELLDKIIAEK